MEKKDFIIGENIIAEIYKYDDQGKEYIRKVRGKVIQATNDFVVIDIWDCREMILTNAWRIY